MLPAIKSVGVQGDERTYAYPIVIRAVTSEDAMTADWARIRTTCSRRFRVASSTRSRASTALLSISRRSRRQRSSGSERRAVLRLRPAAGRATGQAAATLAAFVFRLPILLAALALLLPATGRCECTVHRSSCLGSHARRQREGRGPCHLHAPRRAGSPRPRLGRGRCAPAHSRRAAGGLSVRLRGRVGQVSR